MSDRVQSILTKYMVYNPLGIKTNQYTGILLKRGVSFYTIISHKLFCSLDFHKFSNPSELYSQKRKVGN